jgi:hypothetical protein
MSRTNKLGKRDKPNKQNKPRQRNPVVQAMIENPIRSMKRHTGKPRDEWTREVAPLLRRLRYNERLARLIEDGY